MIADHRGGIAQLEGIGRAGVEKAEGQRGLRIRHITSLGGETFREEVRLLEDEGAVEQIERLERRVRAAAFGHHRAPVGAVEGAKDAVGRLADAELIDHAAELRGRVFLLREIVHHVFLHHIHEVETGAAHFQIQRARDGEHRVADGLGLEPARGVAPEQAAIGIHCGGGARGRGLPKRSREQHQPLEVFHRPAAADEFIGEPVEQFGMRRAAAVGSEIARRIHEPGAKRVLPQPVHHHPRGERILRTRDPLGEFHAPRLLGLVHGEAERADDRQRIRRDDLAFLHRLAAIEPVRFFRFGKRAHPAFLRAAGFRQTLLHRGQFGLHRARGVGIGGREPGEICAGVRLAIERRAVIGLADRLPLSRFRRRFDDVSRRHAVAEFPIARPAPDDATDARPRGQIDLHPALPRRIGSPTAVVPKLPVVDVLQLVHRETRQRARRRRLPAGRHVFPRLVKDLQLIDARLRAVRREDREPHRHRIHRRENFLVQLRIHRRPQRRRAGHRLPPKLLHLGRQRHRLRPRRREFLFRRRVQLPPHRTLAVLHPREYRLHRVIILLRHGIELVIVTPRAAHRDAEKRRPRCVHHVREFVLPLRQREIDIRAFHDVVRPRDEETRRRIRAQRIARELLPDEFVVGLVRVERLHDPVAIMERRLPLPIRLETVRVRVAHHIHPMPRPALAIARTRQHAFHQPRVGLGLRVILKSGHLLRGRRHPVHHEIQPANQRRLVRRRRHRQPLLLQLREHEAINPRARRTPHRLERPVVRLQLQRSRRLLRSRHLRPAIDPHPQHRHLLRRQPRTLWRHHLLRVLVSHPLDEIALRTFPRHDERLPRLPSPQNSHRRIQPHPALLLFLPVAVKAVLLQNRPHLPYKVHRGPGRHRSAKTQPADACDRLHSRQSPIARAAIALTNTHPSPAPINPPFAESALPSRGAVARRRRAVGGKGGGPGRLRSGFMGYFLRRPFGSARSSSSRCSRMSSTRNCPSVGSTSL